MKTIFFRVLEAKDKGTALLEAIREPTRTLGSTRFELETSSFALVPGAPFAYWVREKVRRLFVDHEPLEASGRIARRTNGTTDDGRWIRAAWETPFTQTRGDWSWVPHVKGGAFSSYYCDVHLAIHWDLRRHTYPGYLGTVHRPDVRPASLQHFFRPGLTWPRRTNGLSFRPMPRDCIFGDKGPAVFVVGDAPNELLALCAAVNSAAYRALVALQLARTELAQSFEAGLIQQTPIPRRVFDKNSVLSALARRAWSAKRALDTRTENSHTFTLPALLQVLGETLPVRTDAWAQRALATERELTTIQAEIDARCFDIYGIDEVDRRAMTEGFGASELVDSGSGDEGDGDADLEAADDHGDNSDAVSLAAELLSWAVGVVFGRFDIRLATGERALPAQPEPFDPLPVCSPGMLTGEDGLPLASAPEEYSGAFPENGIRVDDAGHTHDLTMAVRAVFEEVFKARADAWWDEVAAILAPKDHSLRTWLSSSFFEHHLKRYSKSRRKAPILWQLAVPSGRYSVWLYAHRLTRDSFFQVQKDVVTPKLAHEERRLTGLIQSADATPSAIDRKKIAEQEALVEELRSFLDEVKQAALLWNPALDDGVVLTMAPLWRLVSQHKSWQKELKSKWDELAAGKYDWSHAAMHFWPERVVPKCATDRSLAIAHGLEEVFWAEGDDGKWISRSAPTRSIDELVRERTSAAVKAALREMSEASVPNGLKTRTRRSSS